MRVYGIGNPLIDLIFKVEDAELLALELNKGIMHLVDEAQRHKILDFLQGRAHTRSPGGDVPNTLINLALLGNKVCLGGKVGDDEYGQSYQAQLSDCRVLSRLSLMDGKTGSSLILVSPDGERTMLTYLGVCQEFSASDLDQNCLQTSDIVYFTGYMWDSVKQKAAVREAIRLCEHHDKTLAFDLADPFAVRRNRDDFLNLITDHVDILFANAEEVRILCNQTKLEDCAKQLAELTSVVVIKDGANGCVLARGDLLLKVEAFTVQAVDTTGAGDTFASGFIHGILQASQAGDKVLLGLDQAKLRRSAIIASYLASRVISRAGSQLTAQEMPAITKFLSELA